jgi:hypothetical protein
MCGGLGVVGREDFKVGQYSKGKVCEGVESDVYR